MKAITKSLPDENKLYGILNILNYTRIKSCFVNNHVKDVDSLDRLEECFAVGDFVRNSAEDPFQTG